MQDQRPPHGPPTRWKFDAPRGIADALQVWGRHDRMVPIPDGLIVNSQLDDVDWPAAKASLASDHFDNGRSPAALERSFQRSQHVALAWLDGNLVGMARLLSDGVCNAYLLDVWTQSALRRRGIATAMINYLAQAVPGQHIGLQTDDAQEFYATLGFRLQPQFMSRVVGRWLDNDANR